MIEESSLAEFKRELKLLGEDMSILLVEDDMVLLRQMKRIMQNFFSRVDTASNGIEALACTERRKYEIVITDLTMPFMNGITLSRELKNRDSKQIIFVVSAHNEGDKLIELINLGIDGFVLKPLNMKLLLELLKKRCQALYDEKMKLRLSKLLDSAYLELKERSRVLEETLHALSLVKDQEEGFGTQEMSAAEFLALHTEDAELFSEELLTLEEAFQLLLLRYKEQSPSQSIDEVCRILRGYSDVLERLEFFHLLAEQLLFISETLQEIEDKRALLEEMLIYFTEILDHFESFRREIFEYKTNKNIFSMVSLILRQIATMRSTLHFFGTKSATQTQQYDFIIS